MDLDKILAELHDDRDVLDQVIANIEILAGTGKRGRGRPPGSITKNRKNGIQNGTQNGTMKPVPNP